MSSTSSVSSVDVDGVTRHGAGAGILPGDGLSRARVGRRSRPLHQAAIAGAGGAIRSQGWQAFSGVLLRRASVAAAPHRLAGHRHTRTGRVLESLTPPRPWRLERASHLARSALTTSVTVDTGRPLREANNRSCRCVASGRLRLRAPRDNHEDRFTPKSRFRRRLGPDLSRVPDPRGFRAMPSRRDAGGSQAARVFF